MLLENGSDANTVQKDNATALGLAASYRHAGVAKVLIQNDADVNAADKEKEMALSQSQLQMGMSTLRKIRFITVPMRMLLKNTTELDSIVVELCCENFDSGWF